MSATERAELRILKGNVVHGPLTKEEIASLVAQKRLDASVMVSMRGGPWTPLQQFLAAPEGRKRNTPEIDSSRVVTKGQAESPSPPSPEESLHQTFGSFSRPAGTVPSTRSRLQLTPGKLGCLAVVAVLCLIGAIAGLISPSTSSDVLKGDGTAPTREEIRKHVERFGPKPQYSSWDGSFEEVKKYLSSVLNDPNSVDYDFWSKVVMTDSGWEIRVRYRAKNAFGALILKDQVFTVWNGGVVAVRDR
jgi:hypothetical protein